MAYRRPRHRIRAAALVCAVALLGAATTADARAATGSQRRAAAAVVTAYTRAVAAVGRHLAAAERAGAAYVRSTERACSGVLDRVATLGSGQVNLKASTVVGEEVETDIEGAMVVSINRILVGPYVRSIRRLPWSGAAAMLRNAAIAVLRAGTQPDVSPLCADLRTFATNPLAEPPGTIAYFTRLGAQAQNSYATFEDFGQTLDSALTAAQRAQYVRASDAFGAIENTLDTPLRSLYKQLGSQLGLLSR